MRTLIKKLNTKTFWYRHNTSFITQMESTLKRKFVDVDDSEIRDLKKSRLLQDFPEFRKNFPESVFQ